MNIEDIRVGNLLIRHRKIVEVTRVNISDGMICVDNSPIQFSVNNFYPIIPSEFIKDRMIRINLKDDDFLATLLYIQFRKEIPLHIIQNKYFDNYNLNFIIDSESLRLLQQSVNIYRF